ncbi:MAG: biopolymer transporter ExbD [Spirochaetaceae bacterium]|jgi:biopolymer transport protein ExbD|nr:biopolymer transporter ExbD [Spirochaetaceae bacterium]
MTRQYHRARRPGRPDLVPLIDVVFQLILFFLVSTTFAVLPGIRIDLPESDTAEPAVTGELAIQVQADGALWVNGTSAAVANLDARLAAIDTGAIPPADYPVRLEADAAAANGTVVQVFDALRRRGFSAVSLRTKER